MPHPPATSATRPGRGSAASALRRRRLRRARVALVALALVALGAAGALALAQQRPQALARASGPARTGLAAASDALASTGASAAAGVKARPARRVTVIAWQPSHQADTGADWQEYVICGDIVDRAIALLPEFTHVKAWETGMGLTGANGYRPKPVNTPAFDSEVAKSNAASASVFIAVHNDGGAPSGILGMCMPGDTAARALAERLKAALVSATGLPDRGMREERLYSLEPGRNHAATRLLLEIGDNKADRAFLLDGSNRQAIAQALADSLRESELP